ncbi:MAG: hypothetical protein FWD34_09255 [Oscillospiraceae bacterium]|nr:hypothetical protein [Oscillospiraceae bacterium]
MKKLIAVSVVICVVLALTGCGDDNYQQGTKTSKGFESEFINIKFTLPDGYEMIPDKNLEDLMDDVTVYEMGAENPDNYNSVYLVVEKLSMITGLLSEEQYLEVLKTNLEQETAMKYTIKSDTTNVTIAGESYVKMSSTANVQGIEIRQDYIVKKIGRKMVCFIVTYSDDTKSDMDELLKCFKALD